MGIYRKREMTDSSATDSNSISQNQQFGNHKRHKIMKWTEHQHNRYILQERNITYACCILLSKSQRRFSKVSTKS